jgi:hypothetical protein
VRTTLTLDDDLVARLKAEERRTGRSFKEVVNSLLRLGLSLRQHSRPGAPFVVSARRLGARPGITLDNVGELLEQVEGPLHK